MVKKWLKMESRRLVLLKYWGKGDSASSPMQLMRGSRVEENRVEKEHRVEQSSIEKEKGGVTSETSFPYLLKFLSPSPVS